MITSTAATSLRITLAALPFVLAGNSARAERPEPIRGIDHQRGLDEEPFDVKQLALERLTSARDGIDSRAVPVGDRRHAVKELEDAIEELEESLEPKLWLREDGQIEGSRLDPRRGERVFKEERDCVEEIVEAIDDGEIEDEPMLHELHSIIADLVLVDRRLAEIAIGDAIEAEGNPCDIQDALEDLKEGDDFGHAAVLETCPRKRNSLTYKAIDAYRHAWEDALEAIRHGDDD